MLVKRSLPSARISLVDRDELHRRLKEITARIRREDPEVVDVKLFGSFARGRLLRQERRRYSHCAS